jgi:transcriptional regulator with XRE-family HTH domain
MALARMGFEDDLQRLMEERGMSRAALAEAMDAKPPYISKLLNGTGGNFTLKTLVKLARALGALVEVRLVADGRETIRVMTVEEARAFDDRREAEASRRTEDEQLASAV